MQYFRVLLIVCCILFQNELTLADVVEAPVGGIQTPNQEITTVYNTESIALDTLQLPYPILSHTEYFIDPEAKMTVDSVSNEAINSEFKLYNSLTLPDKQGLVWLRIRLSPFTTTPAYLDLGDNVQGIVNVWEKKSEALAIRIHQADNGMYPLSELSGGGEILIAIEGLPSFWFSPTIQSDDEQLLLYKKIQLIIFIVIGVLSLLCFLRGFMEKSDWRFWSGVFGFSALAIAYFGIPATPRGQVISSDLISILALASTLFSLSMIGRYCMTLSFFAKKMDFFFLVLGVLGVFVAVFPFLQDYSWLVRYIELWQLITIIPLLLTFYLMLKGIKASARFFILVLILLSSEIVGILGIGGSVDSSFWAFAPHVGVALGLLLLWISPRIVYNEPSGRRGKGGVNTLRKRAEHAPLDIHNEETIQLTESLRYGQSEVGEPQPIESKKKDKKKAKKSEVKQDQLEMKAELSPQKEEAEIFYDSVSFANSQSCLRIEHALRVPLDAFMHEIYFLEQQVESIRDERKTVILEHVERLLSIGKDLNVVSSSMPRIILNQPKQQRVKVAFNLQDLLRQVYEKIRYEATNAQIALSWVCSPLVGRWFVGEKDALASMIYQLLSDSIRATKKGLVYLHIQRDEASSNYGRLTFIIGDSGQGKPPLNRSSSLLGKAWELAASHDGEFRVENTVQGLEYTFTLSFTALEDDGISEKRSTIKKSSEDLARDIECVMVVSEDTPDRHMLSFRLEKLPCYTVEAMTLNQCMKNYQESPVGVILLHAGLEEDLVMNFIAEVRAFEIEQGIGHTVIVSFTKNKEHEDFLMRAGCNFTLDKNASKQNLRDLISKLLEDIKDPEFLINLIGSKYTSPQVAAEEEEIELKKDDMRLDMNSIDSLEGKDSQKKKESRFSFFKKSSKPKPSPIHLSVSIPDEKGGKSEKVTKISVQSTNHERKSEPFYNDPKNLVTLPSVNKEMEEVELDKNAIELTTEMVSYETFPTPENEKSREKI